MKKKITSVFLLTLLAPLISAAPCIADPAPAVKKTVEDYGKFVQITYAVGHDGECRLFWSLYMYRKKPQFGEQYSLNSQTSLCSPGTYTLASEMVATASALSTMRRDGLDLRKFGVLVMGPLWPLWDERMIDCYIARFGANNRKIQKFEYAELYGHCDILRELNIVLAPYGVRATPDAREKADRDVDFRTISMSNNRGFDQDWIASHGRYSGRAPGGALLNYISIVPLDSVARP